MTFRFRPVALLCAAALATRLAAQSPAPAPSAPGEPPTGLSAVEGGDDQTDKIIASLTPPIPPEAISPDKMKELATAFATPPGGRRASQDEASVERFVKAQWPEAERQEVKIAYRDASRFEVKLEYGTGLLTPQAYPFFFSGMPQGELKLKYLQFLGAGAEADLPEPDRGAQTLGIWVLPEKLKGREADEAVLAMVARAEKKGLAALCVAGPSEFTDFNFAYITTSAKLPPAAANEIDTQQRLRKYPGQGAYLAGLQVGLSGAPRKMPVFFATSSTWSPFADNPREKKSVRMSKLTISGAAGTHALSTLNFILKVPGTAPARAKEWIHVTADWDGRDKLPGATRVAAAVGVLALGSYFKAHPAPRAMIFSLLGGSVWGGAGADHFMAAWPKDEIIYWHLAATALGRMESSEKGGPVAPSKLFLVTGRSYSKSLMNRWPGVVNSFHEIARQYDDLDGSYLGEDKLDRALTEMNGSFPALFRQRRGGTVLVFTGATAFAIDATDSSADKLRPDQLADQVKALGHYAQKLASPAA